ncbi:general stress protein [Actinokineospora sp. HUAS TT18]|uniref:general stress protein n=1 Tax=Actinokineospora sp. HUAS TT18 TaxID=3447451 RepID=UPI003F51F302
MSVESRHTEVTLPDGWPIGSYDTYKQARTAVDHLAHSDFPVAGLAIIGVDPMLVERVEGRLTWQKVLGTAAMSGVWLGLFVGLMLSLLSPAPGLLPILAGLAAGVAFATGMAAMRYSSSRGHHDFISTSSLVARRYDVLCPPRMSERGRDLLAALSLKH